MIGKEQFVYVKQNILKFLPRIANYLNYGLFIFVQHLIIPAMILISTKTVNEFTDTQIERQNTVMYHIYIFYVMGEIFRAAPFAFAQ